MIRVVFTCKVAQDRAAFENSKLLIVMVDNDGYATIGVQRSEPRLLLNVLHDVDALDHIWESVCFFQLLEDDASLVTIGRTSNNR